MLQFTNYIKIVLISFKRDWLKIEDKWSSLVYLINN